MVLASPLIIWTVLLTPVVYVIYNVITFFLDVRRRGRAVDKFPGEPKHWLWGHLHLRVSGRRGLLPSLTGLVIFGVVLMGYDWHKYPGPNEEGLAYLRQDTGINPQGRSVWFGPHDPHVSIHHYQNIKIALQTSEPKPTALGAYGFGKPWIGDGLLLSSGKKWARNRRLLTPAFHFDILKPYMKINNECSDIFLSKIAEFAKTKESYEFYNNVSLYTFDVILRCAMSYVSDVQTRGESHPYVNSVSRLSDLWVDRVLTPWKHFNFLFWLSKDGKEFRSHCDLVHKISEDVIRDRQQKLVTEDGSQSQKKYLDFLDILLKARDDEGKGLTFMEIRDEVDTFMFEGHDTTASGISWTLYSLAEHAEFQEKCQQELDAVLEGRQSDEIQWDDLPKLKYLTQCIKEAMRLHCPVPFISRSLTKDMEIDGKVLPTGSIVDIQIYNLHHNPTIWEDSMEYRPSRFDPDKVEKMDSFAFVPFSAGPRNCIGQNFAMHEMKTVIARILRRFSLALDPAFKVEKKVGVVMRTVDGMKMKVTERNL